MKKKLFRFHVVTGAYRDANDNRLLRYYVDDTESGVIDRRGPGYTKKEAGKRADELNRLHKSR